MSEGAVNNISGEFDQENGTNSRRYFLIQATSAVAAVGAVGAAWPFIKYWTPSAKAKAAGAPVKIDFSKLAAGEMLSPIARGEASRFSWSIAINHQLTHSSQVQAVWLTQIQRTQNSNPTLP